MAARAARLRKLEEVMFEQERADGMRRPMEALAAKHLNEERNLSQKCHSMLQATRATSRVHACMRACVHACMRACVRPEEIFIPKMASHDAIT